MKTSANGRQLIESFEGLILQSYDDSNDHIVHSGDTVHGTLTIGYGHTNAAGPPHISIGDVFTKAQADRVLSDDLYKVEDQVVSLVKVPLNQNQYDALVSFQFNTGALGHSSILPLLNESKYTEAADHLLLYNKSGNPLHVNAGLVRRRQAEKTLFLKSIISTIPITPTKETNIMLQFLSMFLGPTQIGGWVRAGVAAGFTALAMATGLPFLSDPVIVGGVATALSTLVVGLWSSLTKTGTVNVPVVAGSTVTVSHPSSTIVQVPHESNTH
jgi:lysozyme